jgi:hypothetical protein
MAKFELSLQEKNREAEEFQRKLAEEAWKEGLSRRRA